MKHLAPALLLAAGLGQPALALDLGSGFALTGEVQLEYADFAGNPSNGIFTDLTLGWRSQRDSGFGIGADVSFVDQRNMGNDIDRTALWGGLVLGSDQVEVTIGRPRSLIQTMLPVPEAGGFKRIFVRPNLRMEGRGFVEDLDLSGVALKGKVGDLAFGALSSKERIPGFFDIEYAEIVLQYTLNRLTLSGAWERSDILGIDFDITRRYVGADYAGDGWSIGVQGVDEDYSSNFAFDIDAVYAYGEIDLAEDWTAGLQYAELRISTSKNRSYGATLEYSPVAGSFAQVGLYQILDRDVDRYLSASLGYRF